MAVQKPHITRPYWPYFHFQSLLFELSNKQQIYLEKDGLPEALHYLLSQPYTVSFLYGKSISYKKMLIDQVQSAQTNYEEPDDPLIR